jgi:lipopolysaccharide/colanic/teichoic acid biosynthesis glycosyltransferase
MRKQIFWYLTDSIIFVFSFYLLLLLKFGYLNDTSRIFLTSVYIFVIWTVISAFTKKQDIIQKIKVKEIIADITISNVFILGAILILIRLRPRFIEIRFLLIYLILLASILEFIAGLFIVYYNRTKNKPFQAELESGENLLHGAGTIVKAGPRHVIQPEVPFEQLQQTRETLARILIEETDEQVIQFVEKYITPGFTGTSIVSTTTRFNILNLPLHDYEVIINLKRLNDIQFINKFFEAVNAKLMQGGIFSAWVETYSLRKKRVLSKYPWGINYLIYTVDFLIKRVFPKLPVTKKIYFFLTRGQNRVISKAETYGRLYSCGFEIVEEAFIGGRLFFVVRKIKEPAFDYHPTYGPIIRLKRLGKNGKIISVYKLRTMHAYSEYLQGYIYERNKLQPGGKFKDDFRVTTLGRIFRKLWIDELPMLINLIKGDLKLVGVRPLSQHYFDLYTDELKEKRIKYKPGLIPPFYADLPKTLPEIMDSEMRYLLSYEKKPFLTDIRYCWKALWNILFRHARST